MKNFLQLHILTAYGPANLNRDDLGRPKTAIFGDTERLRISSQSLKRAWREAFKPEFDGQHGVRTKRLAIEYFLKPLKDAGVPEKDAIKWAVAVASEFGKAKKADKSKPELEAELETLVFIGPDEIKAVQNLAKLCASENREPKKDELTLLRAKPAAVDISMFGRMLADKPEFNVEAAVQVAHAITVHPAEPEDDYFTAVDDLSRNDESGSSHLGESGFGAGIFYIYICISRQLLVDNLNGDSALAAKAIEALVRTACTVAPSGKQNSFASRSRAFFAQAELGNSQPRQLSFAFLKDLAPDEQGLAEAAVRALKQTQEGLDAVYGKSETRDEFNSLQATGTLTGLCQFATTEL